MTSRRRWSSIYLLRRESRVLDYLTYLAKASTTEKITTSATYALPTILLDPTPTEATFVLPDSTRCHRRRPCQGASCPSRCSCQEMSCRGGSADAKSSVKFVGLPHHGADGIARRNPAETLNVRYHIFNWTWAADYTPELHLAYRSFNMAPNTRLAALLFAACVTAQTITPAPSSTNVAKPSITAVSECHPHGTVKYVTQSPSGMIRR